MESSSEKPSADSPPPEAEKPKAVVVGIPKEIYANERRVAATPTTVHRLLKLGLEVRVQAGAGEAASLLDGAYQEAGARVVATAAELYAEADLVLKVRAPGPIESGGHEVDLMKRGAALVSFVWPAQNKELLERLVAAKATVLAMDQVPRITRAQKLDALSAMANIAGYKAVVEAAHHYGRFFSGQITAAGRVKPAQVLVIGAGVAGLAAIAAARGLGAVVRAFDTRPQVREQVESLGGQFIAFEFKGETGEGEGGYAKKVSEDYLAAEQALIAQHCAQSDIVITTALVPGTVAPILITSGAVVGMARGSVIVDLAAEQGGNCALTERDRVVEKYGVKILGLTDLTSRMSRQASELYATTIANMLDDAIADGRLAIDKEDEVQRGMLVVHEGTITWPPPKPVKAHVPQPPPQAVPAAGAHPPHKETSPWAGRIMALLAIALLVPIGLYAPPDFLDHFTVFLLACIVGWHVVWNVTPALHTPLMSVTNAISGIIVIGGMLLTPGDGLHLREILGGIAVLIASINVAGGFLVTQRMLRMFRR
ncbi:MAG TPA: Re/Si-specific NAD(P)(+) transhydrogenase subunit alpha [Kofleriaceae bacterium]|nr:Re/Si-specific NAD(P)(+) transhydrogenase subunit alpha [Kofleriaceae bacterium]